MTSYIIDKELRDALIGLITLLQLNSERIFQQSHKIRERWAKLQKERNNDE